MKKFIIVIVLTGLFFSQSYADSLLENSDISLSGTLDYFSSYIWRGITYEKDPVIQPGFVIGYKGFSFEFWSSMPVSGKDDAGTTDEIDLIINYIYDFGPVGIKLGHMWYKYPFSRDGEEYGGGLIINNLPVSLSIMYYNDYNDSDDITGGYTAVDAGKKYELKKDITLGWNGQIGSFSDYGAFKTGTVVTLGCQLCFALTNSLSFTPQAAYVLTMGDLADENIGNEKGGLYGGFSLGYSFN